MGFIRLFRGYGQVFRPDKPVDMGYPRATQVIPAEIDRNPEQPAFFLLFVTQAVQVCICFQEGFLYSIPGLFRVMKIQIADSQDVFFVSADQDSQSFLFYRIRALDSIHRLHLLHLYDGMKCRNLTFGETFFRQNVPAV